MSVTDILGLRNDYEALDDLPAADVIALANNLEWVAGGYLEKSVAGSSNVTLSEAEYEVSVLKLTGTLTGSIEVRVPAHAGRRWVVWNATSGAFTVTVKPSGASGIVVTQGFASHLFCDGTDVKQCHDSLASPVIRTGIYDTNGNELILFTATASAVTYLTLAGGATGNGPLLEAAGETNTDLTVRGSGTGGVQVSRSGGKLAFFGATLQSRAAALTQTYSTADRTLSAYTPDAESGAYTGIDNAQGGTPYAQLTDLNALRAAVENLRAFVEDLAQHHNAVVDDLQAYGLEQ